MNFATRLAHRYMVQLGLVPMLTSLHKPYFGDRTLSGYIFSLVLRVIWIVIGILTLVPFLFVLVSLVTAWFLLPILVIFSIFYPDIYFA